MELKANNFFKKNDYVAEMFDKDKADFSGMMIRKTFLLSTYFTNCL